MRNRRVMPVLAMFLLVIFSGTAMTIDSNKYYHIKSVLSGDANRGFWDLPGGGGFKKGERLQLWSFDKGDDRKYMITPAGNGWSYIAPKNAAFGRAFRGAVDVSDRKIPNGSKVHIWDWKLRDNSNQQFKFKDIGGGKFKIYINRGGGKKILCANNNSDANGTHVVPWDDNNRPACQWKFIEAGNAGILYGAGASVVNKAEVVGGWDRYIYAWGEDAIPDTGRWTAIRTHHKKDSNDMGNFWDIPGDGEFTRRAGKKLQLWEMAYKFQKSPEIDRRYKFLPLWLRTGKVEDIGFYIIESNTGYFIRNTAQVSSDNPGGGAATNSVEQNKNSSINSDVSYHWKINNTGKNRFTFESRSDNKYLTASGRASANGSKLIMSSSKSSNSEWGFVIISNGNEKKSTEDILKKRAGEVNKKVADMSSTIKQKGYKFAVKATSVINKTIKEITGAFDVPIDPATAVYMKDDKAPSSLPSTIKRTANMKAFNWRDINKMTPVKDQQRCGSCWAFSGMAVYEGVYKIMYGKELDLSEQYAVDCIEGVTSAGVKADCGSCSGGNVPFLFKSMIKTGVALESEVPYISKDGVCSGRTPSSSYKVKQHGYVTYDKPTVNQIKEAVCKYGPVFSSLKVTNLFMAYGGGIYDEKVPVSGPRDTNHAIVIAGWDDSKGAWLVRNSWSEGWGENGYVWVEYGCANIGSNVSWIRI